MNPSREQELQIDNYLTKLRECLPNMSVADREEIVREISVHIRECAQEPGRSVDEILERVGSPENLASQYGQDLLIRHASRGFSPFLILRATMALAQRGIEGFLLFLGTVIGYGMGASLALTALLKPIFPNNVGLWIGPRSVNFGFHVPVPSDSVHEVFGQSYILVALVLAYFFFWVTTVGIRWYLRKSRQRAPIFGRGGMVQAVGLF